MPDSMRDNLAIVHRGLKILHRRRRRLRIGLEGAGLGVLAIITVLLSSLALGAWPDQPPSALRWLLATGLGACWLTMGWRFFVQALLWRQSSAQTARFVEAQLPEAGNRLINAVQFGRDPDQPSEELVDAAIRETATWCQSHDLRKAVSFDRLKKRLTAVITAILLLVLLLALRPGWAYRGLLAMLQPTRFVPRVNTINVLDISPGNATVFLGDPITITVTLAEPLPDRTAAQVILPGQPSFPLEPRPDGTKLTCALGPAIESFSYAIRLGENRYPADTPHYIIDVHPRVQVERFTADCKFPAYLQMPPQAFDDFTGPIVAPLGSHVTLDLDIAPTMPSVVLERPDQPAVPLASDAAGRYHAGLDILGHSRYRILIFDSTGHLAEQLPRTTPTLHQKPTDDWFIITAIDDELPTVSFTSPGPDIVAAYGDPLPVAIRAGDDHKLTSLTLYASANGAPFVEVGTKRFTPQQDAATSLPLALPSQIPSDEEVELRYYAEVNDNCELPGRTPQTARTPEHRIILRPAEAYKEDRHANRTNLREHLLKLLEDQARLRTTTQICLDQQPTLSDIHTSADALRDGQSTLRNDMLTILDSQEFDADTAIAQQVLNGMTQHTALTAIAQAQELRLVTSPEARLAPAMKLAVSQDAILLQLQALLGILPPPVSTSAAASDDDTPEKIVHELLEILTDFATEQRKILEASQPFAGKSIEDLTDEDRATLKELQVAEEDLHRFLDQAQGRLDKLAAQDFSNSIAIPEVAAIRADVTMAEGALEELATETATAAEANSVENAESLTANIEKWLADTPDRTQWNMEDLPELGQTNEPELPDTLEDMIGELLEEEESLFDAIDDLTSSSTASLDIGAGWDADDGPISSMNAQGVTGNQLPNTSDIAGRSGEGRTGRSEGEFVEDEATGKGGRRTKTRLTDEPYQEGNITDSDLTAPGGATGGGKVSGAGAEGLEGSPPPDIQAELDALAEQQRLLTNRADAFRAQLQANDLAHFALTESTILMNRARKNLEHYDYASALRQRDALLDSLSRSRAYLGGDITFIRDTSESSPDQDGSIHIPDNASIPEDYRRHLQEYYRRLSDVPD